MDYSLHPTMRQVMYLVQTHCGDGPAPALEYAWNTKGQAGLKEDMEAYWRLEREKAATQTATVPVEEVSAKEETQRLSDSRGEEM